jgi:negative regulator of flagellin synthesis FlgM
MKVGSFDNNKPIGPASGHAPAPAADKAAAEVAQPEASAKVALSSTASMLVNDGNAEFDAAKVSRIATAIREGKFEVNAEAIADKLIAHTKEMLAGPQH